MAFPCEDEERMLRVIGAGRVLRSDPRALYELLDIVGRSGPFCCVYRGRQLSTGTSVAVKVFSLECNEDALDDITREIALMRSAQAPNVVRFYECFYFEMELWLVMEFCAGGSVRDLCDAAGSHNFALDERQIAYVIRECLVALDHLHSKFIIHRDIKGSNILITEDGGVRLGDLGVSVYHHKGAAIHSYAGTPHWMAPEIARGEQYGTEVDLWSLGITCIELAEQRPPFHDLSRFDVVRTVAKGPPPRFSDPNKWSTAFRNFTAWLLAPKPSERPSASAALRHAFVADLSGKANPLAELVRAQLSRSKPMAPRVAPRQYASMSLSIGDTYSTLSSLPSQFEPLCAGEETNFGEIEDTSLSIVLATQTVVSVSAVSTAKAKRDGSFFKVCTTLKFADRPNIEKQVHRRVEHFEWLRNALRKAYPGRILPPLPSRLDGSRDRSEASYLRERALQVFLKRLIEHPLLRGSRELRVFLFDATGAHIPVGSVLQRMQRRILGSQRMLQMSRFISAPFRSLGSSKGYDGPMRLVPIPAEQRAVQRASADEQQASTSSNAGSTSPVAESGSPRRETGEGAGQLDKIQAGDVDVRGSAVLPVTLGELMQERHAAAVSEALISTPRIRVALEGLKRAASQLAYAQQRATGAMRSLGAAMGRFWMLKTVNGSTAPLSLPMSQAADFVVDAAAALESQGSCVRLTVMELAEDHERFASAIDEQLQARTTLQRSLDRAVASRDLCAASQQNMEESTHSLEFELTEAMRAVRVQEGLLDSFHRAMASDLHRYQRMRLAETKRVLRDMVSSMAAGARRGAEAWRAARAKLSIGLNEGEQLCRTATALGDAQSADGASVASEGEVASSSSAATENAAEDEGASVEAEADAPRDEESS